jgi:2-keto-4-pentenoate hydratase/2-oxohepta-3-ene-1,7-dioic acid hydratase in catechol pathway
MRLVTFLRDGQSRLGALGASERGEVVYDLSRFDPHAPADMLAFLEEGPVALQRAKAALSGAEPADGTPLSNVTLRAPVPKPGKIICIGQNYLEHAQESAASAPPFPIVFAKYSNTVIAHGEPIIIPKCVAKPDYEGELGVVIGKRGRYIPKERALEWVAGYLPVNDVSARDWQNRTSQWMMGKTVDTFCPMGPALVTADEAPDPQDLRLRTVVSGEVLQEGYTGNMIFTVAHLIADLSQVMTLEPGDVIATGTPSGVGFARTPPRWLRPGDMVRVEIDGIGALENPVAAEG